MRLSNGALGALKVAMEKATPAKWVSWQCGDQHTVETVHHTETIVASFDKRGGDNAVFIAMARNFLPQILEELLDAREALKAWEAWEAGIIQDPACWQGSYPVLTQKHLDALTPAAGLRNRALYGSQEAKIPSRNTNARFGKE